MSDLPLTTEEIQSLNDNVEYLNEVIESNEDTADTPSGQTRDTLVGRLKKLGWDVPAIAYAGSIPFLISDGTKIIDRAGIIYAPLVSALPFTTSGTWTADDENKFTPAQGVNQPQVDDNSTAIADLQDLSGVPANDKDLGTFTGSIISDNTEVKGALQELETVLDPIPAALSQAETDIDDLETQTDLNTANIAAIQAPNTFDTVSVSGTWVVPVGVEAITVMMIGGGGGGGGGTHIDSGGLPVDYYRAGSPGGGSGAKATFQMTTVGVAGIDITIGAGGAGGAEKTVVQNTNWSYNNGVDGGDTIVKYLTNTICTAAGGSKGNGTAPSISDQGGLGGTASIASAAAPLNCIFKDGEKAGLSIDGNNGTISAWEFDSVFAGSLNYFVIGAPGKGGKISAGSGGNKYGNAGDGGAFAYTASSLDGADGEDGVVVIGYFA